MANKDICERIRAWHDDLLARFASPARAKELRAMFPEAWFAIEQQPQPTVGTVDVWPLVIADMNARDQMGRVKYGTPLQVNNGRDALMDAYQEALDLVVYLRQALAERDGR